MNANMYWERTSCRICDSRNLLKYIDFGEMPVATAFKKPGEEHDKKIPLSVNLCRDCGLSQLGVIVKPAYLFSSSYPYNSSVSKTFQEHCYRMAGSLKELFGGQEGLKVLDIASNDGCLLKEFRKQGYECIGVDPAEKLVEKARAEGIETICAFWDSQSAEEVVRRKGTMDVVTATNVFAHIDGVHGFIEGAKKAMSDDGVFVMEASYAKNLLQHKEFDTILHEHHSYYLVSPLERLFSMHDMNISNVEEFANIHGGSIRVTAVKSSNKRMPVQEDVVEGYLRQERENGLLNPESYLQLERNAAVIRKETRECIDRVHARGETIAGYGAPVKGNTFVNYCRLTEQDLPYIVDDTKDKHGLIYAGTNIPIVSSDRLAEEPPNYLLILAWNFADEIMRKTKHFSEAGGKYLIAIPKPRVIERVPV
ncbi:MAG: C-methyltransferase [Parcubacteria group bacterium Gr01-1014_38]|nr:MAG: C-methyltransferase [Parcubacteria group bacterium Gr01-1014_38]